MSKEDLEIKLEEENNPVEKDDLSPAEEKAMASGWRPQEEWDGDPEDWVDARTFNRNGEFMSRIQQQSKQLNSLSSEAEQLKAAMKALGEHNKKIAEQEYKRAVAELKAEKVSALKEDDHEAVVEIDDQLEELRAARNTVEPVEDPVINKNDVAPNPAFVSWANENKWYNTDISLRGAADAIGMEYVDRNVGAPIEDVLEYVTKKMKEEFPHKFGNTRRNEPSPVTEPTGATRRTKKSKPTEKDLTDEQRQFAKMFVDTGAFDSVQEYVDQLVEAGEL